jgi:hypothetical protein
MQLEQRSQSCRRSGYLRKQTGGKPQRHSSRLFMKLVGNKIKAEKNLKKYSQRSSTARLKNI